MRIEELNDWGEISGLTKCRENEKSICKDLEYSFAVHHQYLPQDELCSLCGISQVNQHYFKQCMCSKPLFTGVYV